MMQVSQENDYYKGLAALKTSIRKKYCSSCLHKTPLGDDFACDKLILWPIKCKFLNREDPEVFLLLSDYGIFRTHKYIKKSVLEKLLFPVQFQYPELVRMVKKTNKSYKRKSTPHRRTK